MPRTGGMSSPASACRPSSAPSRSGKNPATSSSPASSRAASVTSASRPCRRATPRFLLACYEAIGEAAAAGKPLILDLRPNGGGDEPAAQKIAGCFVEKPAVYARHVTRSDGQFSEPRDRVLAPNPAGPKFRGKVVVLTGPVTISSCESFVLMMKQAPGCITIGAKTAGSSGNPRSIDLGNGTAVAVPSWKALRLDGTCFEGEGIAPDIELQPGPKDFERQDPILAAAIKKLAE